MHISECIKYNLLMFLCFCFRVFTDGLIRSHICRNIKNRRNATVRLFDVFHMDGIKPQTGFCWSVINELGESLFKMASYYIIYYSWISPSHGCDAIRVLGPSLQRRIGKATFETGPHLIQLFSFLFFFFGKYVPRKMIYSSRRHDTK